MPISKMKGYSENPYYRFLGEPVPFLLLLNWILKEKLFPV